MCLADESGLTSPFFSPSSSEVGTFWYIKKVGTFYLVCFDGTDDWFVNPSIFECIFHQPSSNPAYTIDSVMYTILDRENKKDQIKRTRSTTGNWEIRHAQGKNSFQYTWRNPIWVRKYIGGNKFMHYKNTMLSKNRSCCIKVLVVYAYIMGMVKTENIVDKWELFYRCFWPFTVFCM